MTAECCAVKGCGRHGRITIRIPHPTRGLATPEWIMVCLEHAEQARQDFAPPDQVPEPLPPPPPPPVLPPKGERSRPSEPERLRRLGGLGLSEHADPTGDRIAVELLELDSRTTARSPKAKRNMGDAVLAVLRALSAGTSTRQGLVVLLPPQISDHHATVALKRLQVAGLAVYRRSGRSWALTDVGRAFLTRTPWETP